MVFMYGEFGDYMFLFVPIAAQEFSDGCMNIVIVKIGHVRLV